MLPFSHRLSQLELLVTLTFDLPLVCTKDQLMVLWSLRRLRPLSLVHHATISLRHVELIKVKLGTLWPLSILAFLHGLQGAPTIELVACHFLMNLLLYIADFWLSIFLLVPSWYELVIVLLLSMVLNETLSFIVYTLDSVVFLDFQAFLLLLVWGVELAVWHF